MDIHAEKNFLAQQVLALQKESLVLKLKKFMATEMEIIESDSGLPISEYVAFIEEGEKDIEEGRITSHEDFKKELDSWLEK